MDQGDFLLEEFKALRISLRQHQTAYASLENYTFAGLLIVYGVLFGVTSKNSSSVPSLAWWFIFFLVLIASVRCWGHYLMVRKLAGYIRRMEGSVYNSHPHISGFEHYHHRGILGPWLFLTINAGCWILLLAVTLGVAVFKSQGWPIP